MHKNSQGMIADYAQTSQFEPAETEFACGFFAVALNKYAGFPGKGPTGTSEEVDTWADHEYDLIYGTHGANETGGISIDELHTVLSHAGLQYTDLPMVNASSEQASDLTHIHLALDAGYPVIVTIVESSVGDLETHGNPYEWNPVCDSSSCPTHVVTYVGYGPGYFLVVDPANVTGPLQGTNAVRPWPRKYNDQTINHHFATVVRLPFLRAIPSNNPLFWPQGFDGQLGEWNSPGEEKQAQDTWNSTQKLLQLIYGAQASYTTGIAKSWQEEWKAGRKHGGATTLEFHTTKDDGSSLIVQYFSDGSRCEWDGAPHWYRG